jgi:hypothetical protein
LRSSSKLPALTPIKSGGHPLVPLPSPSEFLPSQPGLVYRSPSRDVGCPLSRATRRLSWGFLPFSVYGTGSPLFPGVPSPARSALRVSRPRSGLLLPVPFGFVSPRNAPGILPSEPSLPEEPYASRRLSPRAVTLRLYPWLQTPAVQSPDSIPPLNPLQGFALSRSPFADVRGLAGRQVGALLGFSSPGVSPSRWYASPSGGFLS